MEEPWAALGQTVHLGLHLLASQGPAPLKCPELVKPRCDNYCGSAPETGHSSFVFSLAAIGGGIVTYLALAFFSRPRTAAASEQTAPHGAGPVRPQIDRVILRRYGRVEYS